MQFNAYDIPEFREAVTLENHARDAAFLDPITDICGIKIRQMTPEDLLILDGLGNEVIRFKKPEANHIGKFLWQLSHNRGNAWIHGRKCRKLNYGAAMAAIEKYMKITFQDAPGGSISMELPIASWFSHRIDLVCSEYGGYTHQTLLRTPLRVIYQLANCIIQRHDPAYKVNALHGEVLQKRLQEKNEEYAPKIRAARQSLVDLLSKRARN